MSGCGAKSTISELVLTAVFHLQQQNGVSVMEVAEYIGEKRCCNPCMISRQIKVALNKAKEHGIMSESSGKYKIEGKYEDKMEKEDFKPVKNDDDGDGNGNGKDDPCVGFDVDRDGEHGHKHKHGDEDGRGNDSKVVDALEDKDYEGLDDDVYRGRELGEPLSKKRKVYLKSRDNYDCPEEEFEDDDLDNSAFEELRDLERASSVNPHCS